MHALPHPPNLCPRPWTTHNLPHGLEPQKRHRMSTSHMQMQQTFQPQSVHFSLYTCRPPHLMCIGGWRVERISIWNLPSRLWYLLLNASYAFPIAAAQISNWSLSIEDCSAISECQQSLTLAPAIYIPLLAEEQTISTAESSWTE